MRKEGERRENGGRKEGERSEKGWRKEGERREKGRSLKTSDRSEISD